MFKAENPNNYSYLVPFLGPFRTQCVVMNTVYKRYKGSELGQVLLAAGVITEGSIDPALKGKHCKRGLRCLKLMYEALVSQLLKGRLLLTNLADETKKNLKILRDTSFPQESRAAAHKTLEDGADLESFISCSRKRKSSDMADDWRDFLSMTDALMQNVYAVHTWNCDEYVCSLRAMLPWMVACDNNRYGKWLPDFWAMLTSLPADQVSFLRTDFAQSITGQHGLGYVDRVYHEQRQQNEVWIAFHVPKREATVGAL